jgi:hypothetical protein
VSQKSAALIQLASFAGNVAAVAFGTFVHRCHVDKRFDAIIQHFEEQSKAFCANLMRDSVPGESP